jgi:predicted nucleotidyltransferase
MALAQSFARELKTQLGPQVRRIVLFGSVARGDDGAHSDIDVLVEVGRRTPALERRVFDAVARVVTDENELIVPLVLSSAERRRHVPNYLAARIRREGKTLA